MTPRKKVRIGDLLVESKAISEEQLRQALAEQKRGGRKLGRTLIELGYLDENTLLDVLSHQLNIPFVDLRFYHFRPELVRRLPETYARRYRAVVLNEEDDGALLVGMADPTDIFAYDELARLLKQPVHQAVVREGDLLRTIDLVYRRTEEITSLAEELGEELAEGEIDLARMVETEEQADAPVVKLLHSLFEDAVQIGASDIHIEPDEAALRIRQRVDGALHEQVMKERQIASALVLRLKLMGNLNISERRLPQDGRFTVKVKRRSIDVRLSTMPVQHGESVVMRLLDQSTGLLDLDDLGMPPQILRRVRHVAHQPHGMVLVTGPTGSGKTTTLYAMLSELNRIEDKLITVEDPVEYRLPRINQVQIHPKIGLSFANVLRSVLRQDPDIVMVGEMRDQETVEIGIRTAMTGHLVLSTLHTNDAVSTAVRLTDMGVPGFMVAASLRAVLAQRLVRRVCESCARPQEPDAQQRAWVRAVLGHGAPHARFVHGAGCPHCNSTGYRGRIGVYELLELDDDMAEALRREDSAAFARGARAQPGYRPLVRVALDYAAEGVTSLDEVIRLAGEPDESVTAGTPEEEARTATAQTAPSERS